MIVISHNLEFDDIFDKICCFKKDGSFEYDSP